MVSRPVTAMFVMNPKMLHDPVRCPDPLEYKPKGHDSNSAQDLLPFPESRRGWVPMQMLLLSSSSSGGRLRSSQAHLALTPLRFEPSVSIPLSTLSCLKRSKTPRLFWMWLEPELDPTLAHPSPQQLLHIPPVCPASTLCFDVSASGDCTLGHIRELVWTGTNLFCSRLVWTPAPSPLLHYVALAGTKRGKREVEINSLGYAELLLSVSAPVYTNSEYLYTPVWKTAWQSTYHTSVITNP